MSDAEISAAREAPRARASTRPLARAAERIVREQHIDDASWATLGERYDEAQLMEVVLLVDTYVTMATKRFGIRLDADAADEAPRA